MRSYTTVATLSSAFKAFNARGKNSRWSWSARAADGRVIMTLWQDQFLPGQPLTYSNVGSPTLDEWRDFPGNQERLENLKWARDRWSGLMGTVIIKAIDPAAKPRAISTAFPRTDLLMKLEELNEDTGEFRAVNVGKWSDWNWKAPSFAEMLLSIPKGDVEFERIKAKPHRTD